MKKISSFVLKICVTFALLTFLFGKADFKALFAVIKSADVGYLAISFLLFLVLNFFVILRWRTLLSGIALPVTFGRVSFAYFLSLFFNLMLPSTIGGDAARTLDLAGHTKRHSSGILATVILDRVTGFFGLFTVLSTALVVGFRFFHEPSIFVVTIILLIIMVFLAGSMFSEKFFRLAFGFLPFERLKDYLYKIHEATRGFRHKTGLLVVAWFLSIVIQAGLSFVYYFLAKAIGAEVPFIYFFLFVPVITVFSVIPITLGGLGVRDATSVAVFAKAGVVAEKAFAMSLLNFGFIFLLGIFGGLIYVINLYRRRI